MTPPMDEPVARGMCNNQRAEHHRADTDIEYSNRYGRVRTGEDDAHGGRAAGAEVVGGDAEGGDELRHLHS